MKVDAHFRAAAADLHRRLASVDVPPPPRRRKRQLHGWQRASIAAALVVAVFVFLAPPANDFDGPTDGVVGPPEAAPTSTVTTLAPTTTIPATTVPSTTPTTLAPVVPPEGPLFGVETGVVLLLDDGIDGVLAIDPDRRLAARSVVDGQRAGDEPYSMIRVGDSLVVGWSEIFAVDIATREATSLGRATIFVPAAEPDRVWLIDWPGGSIGSGTPEVWQVTVDGEQVTQPTALEIDGFPAFGIPGGLAIEHDQGLVLWDAESGEALVIEGEGRARVMDVHGREVVWCTENCTAVRVTDISTLETETYSGPFSLGPARFRAPAAVSPDGRTLAAIAESEQGDDTVLWILDRDRDEIWTGHGDVGYVDYLAWAPDGTQLFATSWSYGETRTTVWRYDVGSGGLQAVILPFGGGLAPVVVDAADTATYFGDDPVDGVGCRAPSVQPSQRTDICTFRY